MGENKNIREFCRQELEADGHCVLVVRDAWKALPLLVENAIDVLVLDIRMPGIDGVQLLKRIRAGNIELPVIFHTAHPPEDFESILQTLKATCVRKSADLSELKRAVAAALHRDSQSGESQTNSSPNSSAAHKPFQQQRELS